MTRITAAAYASLVLWQWVWLFGLAQYRPWVAALTTLPLLGGDALLWRVPNRALMPSAMLVLLYFAAGVMEAYASERGSLGAWVQILLSVGYVALAGKDLRRKPGVKP